MLLYFSFSLFRIRWLCLFTLLFLFFLCVIIFVQPKRGYILKHHGITYIWPEKKVNHLETTLSNVSTSKKRFAKSEISWKSSHLKLNWPFFVVIQGSPQSQRHGVSASLHRTSGWRRSARQRARRASSFWPRAFGRAKRWHPKSFAPQLATCF